MLELNGAQWQFASLAKTPELTARADAARLALVGSWEGLFRSLVGQAELVSGSVRILGERPERALELGWIGVQRARVNGPEDFSVEQYLVESASLLGRGRRFARTQAAAALEQYGLRAQRHVSLGALPALEHRLLGLAQATLGEPRCVFCELPLHRLGETAQRYMLAAVERAAQGRKLVFSVAEYSEAGPEHSLLRSAEAFFELKNNLLTVRARVPERAAAAAWLLTIAENPDRFAARLSAAQLSFENLGPVEALESLLQAGRNSPIQRFRVRLQGDATLEQLLHTALEAEAAILELTQEADVSQL